MPTSPASQPQNNQPATFSAGASAVDWTPQESVHLAGYPHVKRFSTGTHDPLLATALCLHDGKEAVALVAVDVIFITHEMARRLRQRLRESLGLGEQQVMLTATHTHSGPRTSRHVTDKSDPAVAVPPEAVVQRCEDAIVKAVEQAYRAMVPAEAGLVVADARGVGGNRRDPNGPTDPQAPLLMIRRQDNQQPIAAAVVYGMHPTVLHEDSTLYSGDFPHFTRRLLQQQLVGDSTPVLYFTGPAGNQSPRHVTKGNTFAEAQRLGEMLGERLVSAASGLQWRSDLAIAARSTHVQLPLRTLPPVPEAEARLKQARERLDRLRDQGAPRAETRTAEVDWFGAERMLTLAKAAAEGKIQAAAAERSPTEIQLVTIGPWTFVAWPGEIFVEFSLEVKKHCPDTFLIAYANGENQGYLVTQEAVDEGGYEAVNGYFKSPDGGNELVRGTLEALRPTEARA